MKQTRKAKVLALSLAAFSPFLLQGCGGGGGDGGSDGGTVTTAPLAPSATLTPRAIKTFAFSWSDVSQESEYRLLENPDGMSGYSEVAMIPANSTRHTLTVPLALRVNASYILQACNSQGCSDSEEMFVSSSLAEAGGYFKAPNAEAGDLFGYSIALSANGEVMAIGAPDEDSSATGINGDQTDDTMQSAGAVYVFVLDRGIWTRQSYLKASNPGSGDSFGRSLALSADGTVLAVGAEDEDSNATGIDGNQSDNSASSSGAVYVFKQGINTWTQRAYIKASNTGAGDRFGRSLSLSADGTVLAVGALQEDSSASGTNGDQTSDAAVDSGAVYLFSSTAGGATNWSQEVYIKASNTDQSDVFGSNLALSSDGRFLAVSAIWEDSLSSGINGDQTNDNSLNSGAVYVFNRSDGGSWLQQAYLKASNPGALDAFGTGLALSSEGDVLAVGASGEGSSATGIDGDQTNNSAGGSGAVYVFRRSDADWTQQAYIKASNTDEGDRFGSSLALSSDGSLLAVSATGEDGTSSGIDGDQSTVGALNSGAMYLFTQDAGNWSQASYVKASNTGETDRFGQSVALSADGRLLVVGANQEDSNATFINGNQADNSAEDSGAVYLY